jgi:transposase
MMTTERPLQNALFAPQDLGARIPQEHLLRRISETLDLSFVNHAVEDKYGAVGQESIPPTRIMKFLLVLVLYNVPAERTLFRDLPMRIDWLWFLGYDLSSALPNHSILSKARKRWGAEVFYQMFARTIEMCMSAGLIDGRDMLADSSLVDANASVDSLFQVAEKVAQSAMARLDESEKENTNATPGEEGESTPQREPKYRSQTDPDATGAKRRGETRVRPRYQTHRGVDSQQGVITATAVGPGHENEANRLEELVVQHTKHTGQRVRSLTTDSKYGTADNLEYCEWNQIEAYIRPFRSNYTRPKKGKFTECCFRYDATNDSYICPAGQRLTRRQYRPDKDAYRYMAPAKVCATCSVRALCTTSKGARSIHRQVRTPILDRASDRVRTVQGREHRKRRQWMMEGSFAHSVRLGYKRARARGLVNMKIQDYLVATVQNLLILIRAKVRMTTKTARNGLVNAVMHGCTTFATLLDVRSLFSPPGLILTTVSA